MSAVLNGHLEDAKKLIEEGADVNAEDVHGNTVSKYSILRSSSRSNDSYKEELRVDLRTHSDFQFVIDDYYD